MMAKAQKQLTMREPFVVASLGAIYPELVIDLSDPYSAFLEIPVEQIEPVAIPISSTGSWGARNALLAPPFAESKSAAILNPQILFIGYPLGQRLQ